MTLSIQGRLDKENTEAVIVAAIEAGADIIDTANRYCIDNPDFGRNERLIRANRHHTGNRCSKSYECHTWIMPGPG